MTAANWGVSVLFLVIGYLIGSVAFSIIMTKKKGDIRTQGSKNAGATNATRLFGKKTGLIVFILDIIKPIVALLIAYFMSQTNWVPAQHGLIQAAGLGAVVGHIFPLYFKFKGGKGAACMLGFIVMMNWILAIIGAIIFVIIVVLWKYVSVASIMTPFTLIFVAIGFLYVPELQETWSNPIMRNITINGLLWLNIIFLSIIWTIVTAAHYQNIDRLLKGKENKIK